MLLRPEGLCRSDPASASCEDEAPKTCRTGEPGDGMTRRSLTDEPTAPTDVMAPEDAEAACSRCSNLTKRFGGLVAIAIST